MPWCPCPFKNEHQTCKRVYTQADASQRQHMQLYSTQIFISLRQVLLTKEKLPCPCKIEVSGSSMLFLCTTTIFKKHYDCFNLCALRFSFTLHNTWCTTQFILMFFSFDAWILQQAAVKKLFHDITHNVKLGSHSVHSTSRSSQERTTYKKQPHVLLTYTRI